MDSPLQAEVDARGTVEPWPGGWRLAWWVRASDGWHVPAEARASAVSQRLVEGMPVVETGMRMPGGQVVHRAWCAVAAGGSEWAVVEVENRSREPVGVALAVEGARRVAYAERAVRVDGRVALVLPREPSRFTAAPTDGGSETWNARSGERAFVFPLAHTARLRVAVALGRERRPHPVDLAALPDADRVVAGWAAHAQPPGSLRVVLPDGDRLATDRAALLVTHDDPLASLDDVAAALDALDRCGHHGTVAAALPALLVDLRAHRWHGAGRLLVAAAAHHRRTRTTIHEDAAGAVAQAAHKLRRRRDPWARAGQLAAAELLDAAGQREAANRCRQLAGTAATAGPEPGSPVEPPVPDSPAAHVHALLDRLLADTAAGIALLPGYADAWLGQGVEVHDAPTRVGPVSFAVRWHGARPALLWEAEGPVRLACPRLDLAWSTTEPRGEALLAPVGLPGVLRPLAGSPTPASAADDGGTFA